MTEKKKTDISVIAGGHPLKERFKDTVKHNLSDLLDRSRQFRNSIPGQTALHTAIGNRMILLQDFKYITKKNGKCMSTFSDLACFSLCFL